MNQEISHTVSIGLIEDGKWAVVSSGSPRFCLTGNSEAEVIEAAQNALIFYHTNIDTPRIARMPRPVSIQRAPITRTLILRNPNALAAAG